MAESRQSHSSAPLPMVAIEYTQRRGSVALARSAADCVELVCETNWHDQDVLMAALVRLCERCGHPNLRGIGAVAVSAGPGAFTGTRMSLAAAKGLAFGAALPIMAVPSVLVAARAALRGHPAARRIQVACCAKGESFWLAELVREDASIELVSQGACTASDYRPCPGAVLVGDEHLPPAMIAAAVGAGMSRAALAPDACACALSAIHDRPVQVVGPGELAAIYPREPEAVSLWRQRQGLPASG